VVFLGEWRYCSSAHAVVSATAVCDGWIGCSLCSYLSGLCVCRSSAMSIYHTDMAHQPTAAYFGRMTYTKSTAKMETYVFHMEVIR